MTSHTFDARFVSTRKAIRSLLRDCCSDAELQRALKQYVHNQLEMKDKVEYIKSWIPLVQKKATVEAINKVFGTVDSSAWQPQTNTAEAIDSLFIDMLCDCPLSASLVFLYNNIF